MFSVVSQDIQALLYGVLVQFAINSPSIFIFRWEDPSIIKEDPPKFCFSEQGLHVYIHRKNVSRGGKNYEWCYYFKENKLLLFYIC